jgi:hypothetical protein
VKSFFSQNPTHIYGPDQRELKHSLSVSYRLAKIDFFESAIAIIAGARALSLVRPAPTHLILTSRLQLSCHRRTCPELSAEVRHGRICREACF